MNKITFVEFFKEIWFRVVNYRCRWVGVAVLDRNVENIYSLPKNLFKCHGINNIKLCIKYIN